MPPRCRECGDEIPEGAAFCPHCGRQVASGARRGPESGREKNQVGGEGEAVPSAPEGEIGERKAHGGQRLPDERWKEWLREKKRRPRGAEGARGADRELAEGGVEMRKFIHLSEAIASRIPMPPVRDRAGYLRVRQVKVQILGVADPKVVALRVAAALRHSGQAEAAEEYLGRVARATSYDEFIGTTLIYVEPGGEDEDGQS